MAAAEALGWQTQRRKQGSWASPGAVAAELGHFILATQFPAQWQKPEGRHRRSSARAVQQQQQRQQQQGELEAAAQLPLPLPEGARMPTHRELASAGRHDLK